MGKHFELDIDDTRFSYHRKEANIREEAALDGIYVIRTSVGSGTLTPESAVRAYKDLGKVEQAFRCMKTIDLKVRPIFHWLDNPLPDKEFGSIFREKFGLEFVGRNANAPISAKATCLTVASFWILRLRCLICPACLLIMKEVDGGRRAARGIAGCP